jgi:hypothetical protein
MSARILNSQRCAIVIVQRRSPIRIDSSIGSAPGAGTIIAFVVGQGGLIE